MKEKKGKNMLRKFFSGVALILVCVVCLGNGGCDSGDQTPRSASGVNKVTTQVQAGSDGLTTEQRNIVKRLKMDNAPGSVKHLYIVSAYSGQVILYSTVDGKVTSSGKRLTPKTVSTNQPNTTAPDGIPINIAGTTYRTGEVLEDDGAYGDSIPYIYWFDVRGVYHQYYITGGAIPIVSSAPLNVKNITINIELMGQKPQEETPKP